MACESHIQATDSKTHTDKTLIKYYNIITNHCPPDRAGDVSIGGMRSTRRYSNKNSVVADSDDTKAYIRQQLLRRLADGLVGVMDGLMSRLALIIINYGRDK